MAYRSLSDFISALEREGELLRIDTEVSPRLEITEITDRVVKNRGKALLFTNNGTGFPLLINMFGSEKRMSMSLGVQKPDDIADDIDRLMKDLLGPRKSFSDKLKMIPQLSKVASWMPKLKKGRGACQEVIMEKPDLSQLPVLTCWPADGGPFITLPVVHTRDPETGIRNTGMYRMQVMGKDLTGMHWHLHKGSANHFRKYSKLGMKMPVSVILGGDPVYTYCATAPLPENIDEYLLAGFLRKKKVEMVKCITNDLEVPADADFVIEGYVDPGERPVLEGPFGDHTGFYSLADYYPAFHVTCITHRKNAVYPATIVGIPPMEDGWIGKATERIFLSPIRQTAAPELIDMVMPEEGVFHNIALVRIQNSFPGQAEKVMNALWGAGQMMFNKIMIVTDAETDVNDYTAVLGKAAGCDPANDITIIRGPLDVLDHSGRKFAYGSKIGIDATGPGITREPVLDILKLKEKFPEITDINDAYVNSGLIIISLKRTEADQVVKLSEAALGEGIVREVPFIVFVDHPVDVRNLHVVAWQVAGNIDPERDCRIFGEYGCITFDGTRKSRDIDNFQRDWPNVLVMDDETITLVDKKWQNYKLGQLLASPSLSFKSLVNNDLATV